MTACRSSLFLPGDPQLVALDLRLDALGPLVADLLADRLGLVRRRCPASDLAVDLVGLAGRPRARRRRAPSARCSRLTSFSLKTSSAALHPLLGLRLELTPPRPPRRSSAGAAEVEPLRQLLRRLVEGVVDLLAVDLAHDVERRVGHRILLDRAPAAARLLAVVCFRPRLTAHPGGLPERPMGADCKSVAKATEVRILYPPRSAPDQHERSGGRSFPGSSAAFVQLASMNGAYHSDMAGRGAVGGPPRGSVRVRGAAPYRSACSRVWTP